MGRNYSATDMANMKANGVSITEIARRAGVTRMTVYNRLKTLPQEPEDEEVEDVENYDEQRRKIRAFPTNDKDASVKEMRGMILSVLRWYKMPVVKTDEECADRLETFFTTLAETGELPTVEKMALALGTDRTTLHDWEHGLKCSALRTKMIREAKEMLAALDAEMVVKNKLQPVPYIFRAKNYYGMKDQTDVVVAPNNPVGAVLPEEELRKRISGDVVVEPDAIDADFE